MNEEKFGYAADYCGRLGETSLGIDNAEYYGVCLSDLVKKEVLFALLTTSYFP